MRESVTALRVQYARILLARQAVQPRVACLPQDCGKKHKPGLDDIPTWSIWTHRETTADQLRIEERLAQMVKASSSILHIGIGNSSLGRRFAPRVSMVLGTTLH